MTYHQTTQSIPDINISNGSSMDKLKIFGKDLFSIRETYSQKQLGIPYNLETSDLINPHFLRHVKSPINQKYYIRGDYGLYYYDPEFSELMEQKEIMKTKMENMEKDIKFLKNHILYAPGGDGYLDAESEFTHLRDKAPGDLIHPTI